MKKTRNLFVLTGCKQDVQTAMNSIEFKAITVLNQDTICENDILKVFANNKSVVCTQNIVCNTPPILISVVNNTNCSLENNFINIADGDIASQFENIANRLNCDIGDHKSNSSGLTEPQKSSDCSYCRELRNQTTIPQRTIYSSKNFFVVPTLGQFIPGYLLIIPYAHVMSNAELELTVQKELLTVIEDLKYLLNLTYGIPNYLIWENGTGNSGRGKAKDSLVHAHTHIAPSSLSAEDIENLSGFHFEKISTAELSKYNLHSYLLVKDTANTWRISSNPDVYIPRQYVRQLLADEHNIPGEQWNWRTFPFKCQMMQTCADMAEAIRKNWDILPDRIKEHTIDHIQNF